MKNLLYYHAGVLKKFPLTDRVFIIGRGTDSDLIIDEDFISRRHAQVSVFEDCIQVADLGSRNGLFYKGARVGEARVALNESFCLKTIEFFLREGDLQDFKVAPELTPVFKQMGRRAEDRVKDIETRYIEDATLEVLKQLMTDGLKCNSFCEFLLSLSNYLSIFDHFGDLLIAYQRDDVPMYSFRNSGNEAKLLEAVRRLPNLYDKPHLYEPLPEGVSGQFYSFPLTLSDCPAVLLYFPQTSLPRPPKRMEKFFQTLAREIDLVARLLTESPTAKSCPESIDPTTIAINTSNSSMKRLIKEVKRIAASELFVLIEGESGTGKELFARLLHAHSSRRRSPLVAINCAAIPDSLLESEFFGHEKGAFTGAHAQKRGKLELASGGILMLDEIGDMPIGLQAKLLRALEEHEFFRIGGATPIKVDLRIISLTNSRLQELVHAGKFRSDLYYRLVHHVVKLPPLRERREDIPLLINHFTLIFSRQYRLAFKGYSSKAFNALKKYSWPGNVRQLKNEVHRLVSLTGENGLADYDILSEAIREPAEVAETVSLPSPVGGGTTEKDLILQLLAKNGGNKSRTARELNMTYMGLHKKMKRLGIDAKSK